MDSFEFNKIAGAILGTALFVMALSIISEILYEPVEAHTPGYAVAITEGPGAGAGSGPATPTGPVTPIAVRLASASLDNGETIAKKCLACHSLLKDQPAKVGPNLFGVLGGPVAHQSGFKYSDAMLEERGKGLTWTYDNLDKFLANPKAFLPGIGANSASSMGFAGLPKPDERADVIAYIRTLADSPIALPTPGATAAAPPTGPAPAPAVH